MPFGLTNVHAVFQALVSDILRNMLDQFVFVYLDDMQGAQRTHAACTGSAAAATGQPALREGQEMPGPGPIGVLPRIYHCPREYSDGSGEGLSPTSSFSDS